MSLSPARSAIEIVPSVCPHDCTSTCALEVERLDANTIGRVRGSQRNPYTAGVICEKVARYAQRIHHPDRLTRPLKRDGPKGSGQFRPISFLVMFYLLRPISCFLTMMLINSLRYFWFLIKRLLKFVKGSNWIWILKIEWRCLSKNTSL